MNWNQRLTQARQAAGVNKAQLARVVGVKPAAVTQWENGDIKHLEAENCLRICACLGIRPAWLLFGEGPMHQTTEKSIQSLLSLLESLPEREIARAIHVVRAVFEPLPTSTASTVAPPLSPRTVEAKYSPFTQRGQEDGFDSQARTAQRKAGHRS